LTNGSSTSRAAATTNGSSGAATGAAQGVASCSGSLTPCRSFAAPLERSGGCVPAADGRGEPVLQVLGALGILTRQRPADYDALDRLGHVQPGAAQRGVERHHPMGAQPADHLRRLMAGEIVPNEQRAQGRQIGRQREGLRQACLPDRPRRAGRLRIELGRCRQSVQDRREFLTQPWVEDRVWRVLHRLGPDLASGRSEQGEQFDRPAANVLTASATSKKARTQNEAIARRGADDMVFLLCASRSTEPATGEPFGNDSSMLLTGAALCQK